MWQYGLQKERGRKKKVSAKKPIPSFCYAIKLRYRQSCYLFHQQHQEQPFF